MEYSTVHKAWGRWEEISTDVYVPADLDGYGSRLAESTVSLQFNKSSFQSSVVDVYAAGIEFKETADQIVLNTKNALNHTIDKVNKADEQFSYWLRSQRSRTLFSRAANYADSEVAPRVAKVASTWIPSAAMTNAGYTIIQGQDIHGNEQNGAFNRFLRPGISLVSGGAIMRFAPFQSSGSSIINQIGFTDKVLNTTESIDIIIE